MSMSKPKRRAQAALGKNPKLDMEEGTTSQTEKTMDDLPPEVLTIILEQVIEVILNQRRKNMLVYRLVNCQWKDIVDSILEKQVISRRLEAFPEMRIRGQPDQLSVYYPRTVFKTGRNPLSFNSLFLYGYEDFPQGPVDNQMALPMFMSKFGSTLTSFALHDQIIGTKSLAAMLRSMSNLKVIRFDDVELTKRSIGPGWILQPPPLLSLTTLVLKSYDAENDDKRNTLYVWLIASYADQLLHLDLETNDPFPALQKGHEYCIPWRRGENVSIATTSDSAFGKLKKLQVYSPSPQFLRFTQTSALQHLSISGWQVDLRDLKTLISTCGSTLRDISLDIDLKDLDSGEPIQTLPSAGVVARNVKKLTVSVNSDDYHLEGNNFNKTTISSLSMFPALEVIQLIHYEPYELDYEISRYGDQNQGSILESSNESNAADEIISLKQRLASLREDDLARRGDYDLDFEESVRAWHERRTAIFTRLTTLGINANQVIVEQTLERQGVWNICPNLKTVSVSSEEEPVGDVCVIQRMDDA